MGLSNNIHRRQQASTSSVPLRSSSQKSNDSVFDFIDNETSGPDDERYDAPLIRESSFGESFSIRSHYVNESLLKSGPPNLVHLAKYYGTKSALYYRNDFTTLESRSSSSEPVKDSDGYAGFYHFVNGLLLINGDMGLENYIFKILGLYRENDTILRRETNLNDTQFKRDLIVTVCSYNVFSRSDFKARYAFSYLSSKDGTLKIDKSYQIIPKGFKKTGKKIYNFDADSIRELDQSYWNELQISDIIRLFYQLDNPARQLVGLVSNSDSVNTKARIMQATKLLVRYLPKGDCTEANATYGTLTGCGDKSDTKFRVSSYYRNILIDTLIRVCELDISGETSDYAINEIRRLYYNDVVSETGEWDYVILLLFKTQNNKNNDLKFLELTHTYFKAQNTFSTQSALILIEQTKFLISKKNYDTALSVAKKALQILPLDFEAWYMLTLSYILCKDYTNALLSFNSLPVINLQKLRSNDLYEVSGVKDIYSYIFLDRMNSEHEAISEKSFQYFFPCPMENSEKYDKSSIVENRRIQSNQLVYKASISKLWNDMFLFNPSSRHPIAGNILYQSPIVIASTKELSSVSPALIKVCGPTSTKLTLAARSSMFPTSSLLDFNNMSTWGRCYDLLTFFVAIYGWDRLVSLKENTFSQFDMTKNDEAFTVNKNDKVSYKVSCESWVDQIFLVVYEDLRTVMRISKETQHSAIEWNIKGLLGWSVKYNILESISSLMTSVMGTALAGGFDMFGTIKLLEIYDELILSDIDDSKINVYMNQYQLKFHACKLILDLTNGTDSQLKSVIEEKYLTLDFILLNLMRLISWNVRWYEKIPTYLISNIISKLCIKFDAVYLKSKVRIVFEQNKTDADTGKKLGAFSSLFSSGKKDTSSPNSYFDAEDTVSDYTELLIDWIEAIRVSEGK